MTENHTSIYYNKKPNLIEMAFIIATAGVGTYLLYREKYLSALILIGYFCYQAFKAYRHFFNNSPQIIISIEGIETVSTSFHPWEDIQNEDVISVVENDQENEYLVYDHTEGPVQFLIGDFDIKGAGIKDLLVRYRAAHEELQAQEKR